MAGQFGAARPGLRKTAQLLFVDSERRFRASDRYVERASRAPATIFAVAVSCRCDVIAFEPDFAAKARARDCHLAFSHVRFPIGQYLKAGQCPQWGESGHALLFVIPAQAGIQFRRSSWIPAFAGMTTGSWVMPFLFIKLNLRNNLSSRAQPQVNLSLC
jgi:hypothetical protein